MHTTYLVSGQNDGFGHPSTTLLDQWQPVFCHLISIIVSWFWVGEEGGREWVWSGSHGNVRLQGAYPIESCLLSDIIYNADHVSLGGKVTSFSRNNSNIWTTVLRIQVHVVTDFVCHTRITKNTLVVINKTTD